jgi:hypothetical protein
LYFLFFGNFYCVCLRFLIGKLIIYFHGFPLLLCEFHRKQERNPSNGSVCAHKEREPPFSNLILEPKPRPSEMSKTVKQMRDVWQGLFNYFIRVLLFPTGKSARAKNDFHEFLENPKVKGYASVISKPMSIFEISRKMNKGDYDTIDLVDERDFIDYISQFIHDFDLIYVNCCTFNTVKDNEKQQELRELAKKLTTLLTTLVRITLRIVFVAFGKSINDFKSNRADLSAEIVQRDMRRLKEILDEKSNQNILIYLGKTRNEIIQNIHANLSDRIDNLVHKEYIRTVIKSEVDDAKDTSASNELNHHTEPKVPKASIMSQHSQAPRSAEKSSTSANKSNNETFFDLTADDGYWTSNNITTMHSPVTIPDDETNTTIHARINNTSTGMSSSPQSIKSIASVSDDESSAKKKRKRDDSSDDEWEPQSKKKITSALSPVSSKKTKSPSSTTITSPFDDFGITNSVLYNNEDDKVYGGFEIDNENLSPAFTSSGDSKSLPSVDSTVSQGNTKSLLSRKLHHSFSTNAQSHLSSQSIFASTNTAHKPPYIPAYYSSSQQSSSSSGSNYAEPDNNANTFSSSIDSSGKKKKVLLSSFSQSSQPTSTSSSTATTTNNASTVTKAAITISSFPTISTFSPSSSSIIHFAQQSFSSPPLSPTLPLRTPSPSPTASPKHAVAPSVDPVDDNSIPAASTVLTLHKLSETIAITAPAVSETSEGKNKKNRERAKILEDRMKRKEEQRYFEAEDSKATPNAVHDPSKNDTNVTTPSSCTTITPIPAYPIPSLSLTPLPSATIPSIVSVPSSSSRSNPTADSTTTRSTKLIQEIESMKVAMKGYYDYLDALSDEHIILSNNPLFIRSRALHFLRQFFSTAATTNNMDMMEEMSLLEEVIIEQDIGVAIRCLQYSSPTRRITYLRSLLSSTTSISITTNTATIAQTFAIAATSSITIADNKSLPVSSATAPETSNGASISTTTPALPLPSTTNAFALESSMSQEDDLVSVNEEEIVDAPQENQLQSTTACASSPVVKAESMSKPFEDGEVMEIDMDREAKASESDSASDIEELTPLISDISEDFLTNKQDQLVATLPPLVPLNRPSSATSIPSSSDVSTTTTVSAANDMIIARKPTRSRPLEYFAKRDKRLSSDESDDHDTMENASGTSASFGRKDNAKDTKMTVDIHNETVNQNTKRITPKKRSIHSTFLQPDF